MKHIFPLVLLAMFGIGKVNAQECGGPVFIPSTGDEVQFTVFAEADDECFQFYWEGQLLTPNMTQEVTFYTKMGDYDAKLVSKSGITIEKKITLISNKAGVTYVFKENKKGEPVLRTFIGKYDRKGTEADAIVTAPTPTNDTPAEDQGTTGTVAPAVSNVVTNCNPYTSPTLKGNVTLEMYSEDGDCFKVFRNGEYVTPDYVSKFTWQANATGSEKFTVLMADGTEIERKVMMSPDYQSLLLLIKKNNKGKYSIKNKMGQMELTAEAQQKRAEEQEQRRKELAEKTKPSEPEESESKGLGVFDGNESAGSSGSSGNSGSSMSSGNSGGSSGTSISSGRNEIPMKVTYEGRPVTDTKITLEIGGVVIGTAMTDSNGDAIIKTDLPVDTERSYKLSGVKGNTNWSFSGIFLLNPPPKVTPVPMDIVIKEMAGAMGMSESVLASSWGFK